MYQTSGNTPGVHHRHVSHVAAERLDNTVDTTVTFLRPVDAGR